MDELVQRLRKPHFQHGWHTARELLSLAADEIERLRAAISGWQDHYGWKDGEYVDNVNDVFKPLLPAVTVSEGKP